MKLRHPHKFGNYAGTCWRLLFTFSLMPWMRKYRLNPDNIEVTAFKFAAMRMWTGRMPKEMSLMALNGTAGNEQHCDDDGDMEKTNAALRQELARLQTENEMLRHAVYGPTQHATPRTTPGDKKYLSMSMPHMHMNIGEY